MTKIDFGPKLVTRKMMVRSIEGRYEIYMMEDSMPEKWLEARVTFGNQYQDETTTVTWPTDMPHPKVGDQFMVIIAPITDEEREVRVVIPRA